MRAGVLSSRRPAVLDGYEHSALTVKRFVGRRPKSILPAAGVTLIDMALYPVNAGVKTGDASTRAILLVICFLETGAWTKIHGGSFQLRGGGHTRMTAMMHYATRAMTGATVAPSCSGVSLT
jgi:hypothetical protein